MRIREGKVGNYDYIIITLTKGDDERFLNSIKEKANNDEKQVYSRGPNNEIRSEEVIKSSNLGGVLAEESIKAYLKKIIEEKHINAEILPSPFTGYLEHRDIKIKVNGIVKTIEIRSSFQYIQPDFSRVINGSFSLISYYYTAYKKQEPKKDFYITVYHRYQPSEIIDRLNKEVDVFFVGGASYKVFDEMGYWDDLRQKGAHYFIIKPINKTKGVKALMNEILEIKEEVSKSIKQSTLFNLS